MLVCCRGWRAAICVLDGLQHLVLGRMGDARPISLVCRLHDWAIGMTWEQAGS